MLAVVATIGDVLSATLIGDRPLALIALTPRTAYLVAATHKVPFAMFLLVATARLCVADPLHFMLGRTVGPTVGAAVRSAASRSARLARMVPRGRRAALLWFAVVALSPTAKTMLVTGGAGVDRRHVAAADLLGTVARLLLIWGAGRAFPSVGPALAAVAPWITVPGGLLALGLGAVRLARRRIPDGTLAQNPV